MAKENGEKKVITLDTLKVVTDKLKKDYYTSAQVDEKLENIEDLDYATDAEVLALFDEETPAEEENPAEEEPQNGDEPAEEI